MDLALNTPPTVGNTLGVTAAAYVNNDNDSDTGTLLFDIDTALDQTGGATLAKPFPRKFDIVDLAVRLG